MQSSLNHVNMIGKLKNTPFIREISDGRRVANFNLEIEYKYLDAKGLMKISNEIHRVSAKGKWVLILESLVKQGMRIAIEGRLSSRIYAGPGGNEMVHSEVEINDLVIL